MSIGSPTFSVNQLIAMEKGKSADYAMKVMTSFDGLHYFSWTNVKQSNSKPILEYFYADAAPEPTLSADPQDPCRTRR